MFTVLEGFCGILYNYDSLNRLTNVNYGNGSFISYTYDAAGNRLTYSGLVTNDAVAPSIAITSPTTGVTFSTTVPLVNLGGTASDNVGVTLVDWSNDRGGMGTASGTTNWSVAGIALQLGTNVISVTAYDAAGNAGVAALAVNYVAPGPATNALFTDAFSDNVIDTSKWTASGNTVTEASQTMQVLTTVTDNGGVLLSVPVPMNPIGDVTISRRVFVHHGSDNYVGYIAMRFGDLPIAAVFYGDATYSDGTYMPRYGTFIGKNVGALDYANISLILRGNQTNITAALPVLWDTWFDERIAYSPTTGILDYFVNGQEVTNYFVGIMPATNTPTMQFGFRAWGWFTGHQELFDDFLVTQTAVAAPQVELTGMSISSNRVFSCVLNGPVGSNYVVKATTNLVNWSPLSTNTISPGGWVIITDPAATNMPRRFYRATAP